MVYEVPVSSNSIVELRMAIHLFVLPCISLFFLATLFGQKYLYQCIKLKVFTCIR